MDPRDFQKGYRQLLMPLGMYALRITGDVDAASDVVQSAFEAAWLRVGEIVELRPYMYRVVRHAALRWAEQQSRMEQVPLSYCGEVTEADVDTSERDARLWQAIDRLPDRCRQVFLLSKRDGMSHAEIAAELSISTKTVEAQIAKAVKRLRADSRINPSSLWVLAFF